MVGKVVIGAFASSLVAIASVSAQQVEIPREKPAVVVPQPKTAAQPQIELRPKVQTVSYATTATTAPSTTLSVEQMRKAGAIAGQRVREEMHDIEEDEPPPKPAPAKKPTIAANAVRVIEKPSRESETFPAPPINFSGQTGFVRLADGF